MFINLNDEVICLMCKGHFVCDTLPSVCLVPRTPSGTTCPWIVTSSRCLGRKKSLAKEVFGELIQQAKESLLIRLSSDAGREGFLFSRYHFLICPRGNFLIIYFTANLQQKKKRDFSLWYIQTYIWLVLHKVIKQYKCWHSDRKRHRWYIYNRQLYKNAIDSCISYP